MYLIDGVTVNAILCLLCMLIDDFEEFLKEYEFALYVSNHNYLYINILNTKKFALMNEN